MTQVSTELSPLLHLSNDFMHQEVYPQLISHLEARGLAQWIFVAARDPGDVLRKPPDTRLTRYSVRHILRPYHKVFFRHKMSVMRRSLESSFDLCQVAMMHAHFLYTDGTVAAAIHARHGTPFVVSVRPTTDIFSFMRYRPDLLRTAIGTLRSASAVICLTPGGSQQLLDRLPVSERLAIGPKIRIVPSGIGRVWQEPPAGVQADPDGVIRMLSISDMSPNKNVAAVISAGCILQERGCRVRLTLVGGNRKRLPARLPDWVEYIPHISDRIALRDLVRRHDVFVMPSFAETFGLVYVEALSQGVPIVHSRGQAVAGLFSEGQVAISVDPSSSAEVADAAEQLAGRRPRLWRQCIDETQRFRWNLVADQLHGIYNEAGLPPVSSPSRNSDTRQQS